MLYTADMLPRLVHYESSARTAALAHHTLLFSANEAYAMLDGIKALKEDIRFIASTRSFIVYDRIEDIRYRIIE